MNSKISKRTGTLEFWFDLASNYSYLSVMRIEALIADTGIALSWRPFLLGPIFKENGWNTSPFNLQQAKGSYVWKDMVRQTQKYEMSWKQPTVFPRNSLLSTRIALSLDGTPWMVPFVKSCMHMNFVLDEEIHEEAPMASILTGMGLDAQSILKDAQSEHNKQRLKEQVNQAKRLGLFGAPTFVVDGELFWGNDRLEDAIDFAKHI